MTATVSSLQILAIEPEDIRTYQQLPFTALNIFGVEPALDHPVLQENIKESAVQVALRGAAAHLSIGPEELVDQFDVALIHHQDLNANVWVRRR